MIGGIRLDCPNGHGSLELMFPQYIYLCDVCGWGVSGLDVHANVHRKLSAMIADKAIGRQYYTAMVVDK